MTDEHECDFPDTCPVCNTRARYEEPSVRQSRPFPAKFDGDCPGCSLPIYKGEMIVMVTDGSYDHAEHQGCAL